MVRIDWYTAPNGKQPAKEFVDGLDSKMKAKLLGSVEYLRRYGPQLRMPYSRYLRDGIFELRAEQGGNITRVLYFFFDGGRAILTNGFTKKTQATPAQEITKAKKYRDDWRKRNG